MPTGRGLPARSYRGSVRSRKRRRRAGAKRASQCRRLHRNPPGCAGHRDADGTHFQYATRCRLQAACSRPRDRPMRRRRSTTPSVAATMVLPKSDIRPPCRALASIGSISPFRPPPFEDFATDAEEETPRQRNGKRQKRIDRKASLTDARCPPGERTTYAGDRRSLPCPLRPTPATPPEPRVR